MQLEITHSETMSTRAKHQQFTLKRLATVQRERETETQRETERLTERQSQRQRDGEREREYFITQG